VDSVKGEINTLCINQENLLTGDIVRENTWDPYFEGFIKSLRITGLFSPAKNTIMNDGSNITTSTYIVGSLLG